MTLTIMSDMAFPSLPDAPVIILIGIRHGFRVEIAPHALPAAFPCLPIVFFQETLMQTSAPVMCDVAGTQLTDEERALIESVIPSINQTPSMNQTAQ